MGYGCEEYDDLFEVDLDHTAASAAARRHTFICRQDDNALIFKWFDHRHLYVNVLVYYKKLEDGVLLLRLDKSFCVHCQMFLDGCKMLEFNVQCILGRVDLPQGIRESILHEVMNSAHSMLIDDSKNAVPHHVIPMTVEVVVSESEKAVIARTSRDSILDTTFPPCRKEYEQVVLDRSISEVVGGLEKVAHDSCSVKPQCSICFEAILVGNRLPCSHIYHRNCIYRWLKKRDSCPLCRFAMLRN